MKHIFRKNQVIITALAIMIAVAGYLQFNQDKVGDYGQNTEDVLNVAEDGTIDVNSNAVATTDVLPTSDAVTDNDETADISDEDAIAASEQGKDVTDDDSKETAGEAVLVNNTINADFFAAAKLDREQTRAKNKEKLMELVNNENLSEAQKEDAVNGVIKLTEVAEIETATETLLKAKGFTDVVVSIVSDKVNVIVSADHLTDQQKAQIEDIVKNETKADIKNIVISPVKVAEKE